MRKLITLSFAAVLAAASIGCEPATNTTVNKAMTNANSNGNLAVVVNDNSKMAVNTNSNANKSLTKDEYDKNKDTYAKEAKDTGSKIGQGAEDGWLFTKLRFELGTASDVRASTINVDVDNAVVTLRGTVASKEQETKAVAVAKGVDGVKEVKNMLKVDAKDSMTNQMVNGNSSTKATNAKANMNK